MLAQRQEKMWLIFRRSRKMNHIPLSTRAKQVRGRITMFISL
ncbi:MAG: hypothetical protein U5L45_13390 [Saprospiraceae bacterium]|nr:hypothetical protein [Saprospiraceae bacterium]